MGKPGQVSPAQCHRAPRLASAHTFSRHPLPLLTLARFVCMWSGGEGGGVRVERQCEAEAEVWSGVAVSVW